MTDPPNAARIERARARLAANLGELQQRITRARTLVSPRTYLANPWLKVGLGIAAGYLVGRRYARRRLAPGDLAAPGTHATPVTHGLIHAALRTAVISAAGALIETAIARLIKGPSTRVEELEPASSPGAPPGVDP